MQFISQLFEYMTGLDTRIGFPNEHLGKSVLEEVKSPMYATTVGLVLAGFKSLDTREEMYQKRQANTGVKPKQMEKREVIANNFFKNIGDRLKNIISDDIGEDTTYQ
jgi:cell division protein FtsA